MSTLSCVYSAAPGWLGRRPVVTLVCGMLCATSVGCDRWSQQGGGASGPGAHKETFGMTPEGLSIDLYTLTNTHGLRARLTNFGAAWVSMEVPDRNGTLQDVTLGYDTLEGYVADPYYLGATVGRVASVVRNARFTLNGTTYTLARNRGENSLHGGVKGFNKQVWTGEVLPDGAGVRFRYLSRDGEEGYPGNLSVTATYTLMDDNGLTILYEAETDKSTVLNLTNHAYFNLRGDATRTILGHELAINADRCLRSGAFENVEGTPFDFRPATAIGARIAQVEGGYDLTYDLRKGDQPLALAARVTEPQSGRVMEVMTTQPALILYTGNYLDGRVAGKRGHPYQKQQGFCLEAVHFPDSPNHPEYPTVVLNPGEHFAQTTVYRFSTR